MSNYRLPTAFVSHGGGPWPLLSLDGFEETERAPLLGYMQSLGKIPKQTPKALLVVSAHWEGPQFTINTNPNPKLLFDYYGFPEEAYQYKWPVRNDLNVVEKIKVLCQRAQIPLEENDKRDYDHGIFIPLMVAYPQAKIPVVQISLKIDLDPLAHFSLGQALAPLREEGVFIVGSGNSYHNLKYMFHPNKRAVADSKQFDLWLKEALVLEQQERKTSLLNWQTAPAARESHPREEHLIPLMVAAGAAQESLAKVSWTGHINGTANSAFHFED